MLTKLKLAVLLSAPLVAGAATYAAAQATPPKLVEKDDGTADARRAARKAEAIARFDANGDGKLDAAEKATMREARLTDRFQAMDTNHDGKLSLDEFKAGAAMHRHGRHGHGHHRGAAMKP